MPNTVLKVTGLGFNYPQLEVLNDFSATLSSGVSLIQGGDGRGKTTLIRLLAGDLPMQAGQLQLTLAQDSPGKVAQPAQTMLQVASDLILTAQSNARQISAFQKNVFWTDPRTTALDQISPRIYFEQQRLAWPGFDSQALPDLIDGLSLNEFLDKPLYMLSTGSKRKVWLAAAFASNAAVALLDDPFAALDKPSIRFVTEFLSRLNAQSQRAVVITGYAPPDGLLLAGVIDLGE